MDSKIPFVHFPEEPGFLRDQVASHGGRCIRHSFGERGYNPGLTRNRWANSLAFLPGEFLMTYRSQEISRHISVSHLNICGVDACGTMRWTAPLLLPDMPGHGTPMHEDGRLFWFSGKLFLAYSNVRLRSESVSFKQSLVELTPDLPDNMFEHKFTPSFTPGVLKHLNYGKNAPLVQGHEKNWQFFETEEGDLAFVYSINPHVVVLPGRGGKHYWTQCAGTQDWTRSWGDMHGGTPPILLPDGSYLSFFNSFVGHSDHQRRYVIGAYIFAGAEHKFKVTHVLNKPLIIGSEREGFLWESPVHWEPIVAFATGAAIDAEENVRLSYGVNDCYAETAIIPLANLFSMMVPV